MDIETLILGGSDKGLDYQELMREIEKKENIKNLILIGDVGNKITDILKGYAFQGSVINMGHSSMEEIVKKAFEITPRGGIVILSPAAASFDMFKDYKDRGNQFKKSVFKLRDLPV